MREYLTIVVGFILTTLIGNRLLQQWQTRAWLLQQQFLGQEKDYLSLKAVLDELLNVSSRRLYRMKRLLWAIRSMSPEEVEKKLSEYDETLIDWNEGLNRIYVGITQYSKYYNVTLIDEQIQTRFSALGSRLEALVRARRSGGIIRREEIVSLSKAMDLLQRNLFEINRDFLRALEEIKKRVYYGEEISYTLENLNRFSLYELIKALFVHSVDHHSIIRPPTDSTRPARWSA